MTSEEMIIEAVNLATVFGFDDGSHHKQWVIDQMLRILLGKEEYENFRKANPDWDPGIAP